MQPIRSALPYMGVVSASGGTDASAPQDRGIDQKPVVAQFPLDTRPERAHADGIGAGYGGDLGQAEARPPCVCARPERSWLRNRLRRPAILAERTKVRAAIPALRVLLVCLPLAGASRLAVLYGELPSPSFLNTRTRSSKLRFRVIAATEKH